MSKILNIIMLILLISFIASEHLKSKTKDACSGNTNGLTRLRKCFQKGGPDHVCCKSWWSVCTLGSVQKCTFG